MTVEGWKTIFDWGTVILLFLTFAFGYGVLVTGNIINKRQEQQLRQFDKDLTDAKIELGQQQERAANAEQSAAEAKKATEDERLARIGLERQVAWRTISPEQQIETGKRLKRFQGIRIAFTFNTGDAEGLAFASQIASTATKAGWETVALAPMTEFDTRTGVTITTTEDQNTREASDALTHELVQLRFKASRSPKIDPRSTDPLKRPLLYVFVGLRPQAGEIPVPSQGVKFNDLPTPP